jgi:hypothetical protein
MLVLWWLRGVVAAWFSGSAGLGFRCIDYVNSCESIMLTHSPHLSHRIPRTYQVCIILKKILRSAGIKTESVSEMAKGFPPRLGILYSSGFERQPSRFDGLRALDR